MSGLPGKYGKYILIALILGIAAHSISIYLFKVAEDFDNRLHDFDKRLAILDERMGYLSIVKRNTETLEDSGSGSGSGIGGYNAAEQNVTTN
ncbi:MAG TPA: hypothetical protein VGE97_03465 [Nitrososphaera sp.]